MPDADSLWTAAAATLAGLAPDLEPCHLLGAGGGGVALAARRSQRRSSTASGSQLVAVKLILPDSHNHELACRALMNEAESLAGFNHPNIVSLLEHRVIGGEPLLLLELLEGGSVADRVDGEPWQPEAAMAIALAAARGLEAIHHKDMLYLDMKPGNLGLTADGTTKIMDLGHAYNPNRRNRKLPVATPDFLAPEQLRAGTVGPWTDCWALGMTLYVLLSGRIPRRYRSWADAFNHGVTSPKPLHSPQTPAPLVRAVDQLLSEDQGQRTSSGSEAYRLLLDAGLAAFGPQWSQHLTVR